MIILLTCLAVALFASPVLYRIARSLWRLWSDSEFPHI